ncbi:MAG: hypothetical protein ACRDJX_09465 [Solirubrobacteraceae bacterium]
MRVIHDGTGKYELEGETDPELRLASPTGQPSEEAELADRFPRVAAKYR